MNNLYRKMIYLLLAIGFVATLLFTAPQVSFSATSVKMGSEGGIVRVIQRRLKTWGYYDGNIDGIYGEKTRDAVIKFQQKNGAKVDGIVGTETAALIGINLNNSYESTSTSGSTSSSNTSSDLYLLARVVYGEARGEPYVGQVAVAAVILNRVKHPSFPNTISGVIYQKGAFTATVDGQINVPISENSSVYKACRDAMNGWDPTGGAIYYYNPKKTTNKWIYSREVIKIIGSHRFAK